MRSTKHESFLDNSRKSLMNPSPHMENKLMGIQQIYSHLFPSFSLKLKYFPNPKKQSSDISVAAIALSNMGLEKSSKQMALFEDFGGRFCKLLGATGLLIYLFILLFNNPSIQTPEYLISSFIAKQHHTSCHAQNHYHLSTNTNESTTNLNHIVFGLAGSVKTSRSRGQYAELWWRPNITRGFVWLDQAPNYPWPSSSPPFRVSEEVPHAFNREKKSVVRLARTILESFRAETANVRWYVMGDDDTVFCLDNLQEVLSKYDYKKHFYIGGISESMSQNTANSFGMAFGGAGYALSFSLVKTLASFLDDCLKRYQDLFTSDHFIYSCVTEMGVSLTREPGFHQIDLHGNMMGYLSAHPQAPFVSLHHIDHMEPIFPSMDRGQGLKHLAQAMKVDSSRLFQQSICYDRRYNRSLSVSWGYLAQIYEKIHPPSMLNRPFETFLPWTSAAKPPYMFNVRVLSKDPCQVPHFFFFDSINITSNGQVLTEYIRKTERKLPTCVSVGNHSADAVLKIRVFSPGTKFNLVWKSLIPICL
ncbi:hypothetical protein ACLOJK_030093 [Asimina triloba]